MTFYCKELNERENKKNEFEPKCGTEIFKTYYNEWDPKVIEYLDYINNINDPVLQYISIYFVQYYIDGHKYFGNGIKSHTDGACGYLRQWLLKQNDLFTYGGKYQTKINLWNEKIPSLWKMLMKDYNNSGNTAINSWCNYRELIRNASFPPGVNFPNFEKVVSHEPSSVNCPLPSVQTQCNCTPCEMPGISPQIDLTPQTDQTRQTDRTKNLAVTSGFTAVGTLGTLFFLYRFTPMMSWFRRPGMNNVGTDLYMNPGGAESFLSMQKDNGSNNLFYHP